MGISFRMRMLATLGTLAGTPGIAATPGMAAIGTVPAGITATGTGSATCAAI
eukprot:CAMPEP_0203648622 /NCGR_PEP_ID=MMETSP0088-20131115/19336_1 /ASSEMBLY_ACC=CAM_ASM_001087 /TAXON_ID=426623 /ORGANISM="Chaetoceros affinis, Strain CCMP159" /LENGTH=51 /DNA_ID=CAMNT_0050506693 /DNA_START=466 /DNA_END=621 /DNA_ORIENTATION=+